MHQRSPKRTRVALFAAAASLALILAIVALVVWPARSQAATQQHPARASVSARAHKDQAPCSTSPAQWTPTGHTWRLTVTFEEGSRAGQSERSVMTFAPNGTLTATFPGATPGDPPTLLPAIDGFWCLTGSHTFFYQFKEPMLQQGTMVAYVLVHVEAYLESPTTYEGVGFGVATLARTGQPLPGQYGRTLTSASAMS